MNHSLRGRTRYPGLVNENIFGFTPATLPNLQLWLDAAKITGLSDNDKVSQWDDLSGYSRHAVQANNTYKPLYKTGIKNGFPAVKFGSANGVKLTTPAFSLSTVSVYIVTQRISVDVTYPIILVQDDKNSGINIQSENSVTTFRYVLGNSDIAGSALINGNTYLLSFLASTTNIYAWINTISQGSKNNSGGNTARSKTISLGEGSGNRYTGYIMEVIIFSDYHSDNERLNVMKYLNKKWAIW